jgi:hypothetical protein
MKKQVAFFEAYEVNSWGEKGRWRGTATLKKIKELQLGADLWYPLYGDETLAVDGWGFKAP